MNTAIFDIKIIGMSQLLGKFASAPQIVEPILQQGIIDSSAILADHTDQHTVPFRQGNLIRSFDPVTIDRLFAKWYPRADYARAVQYGMPPSPGRFVPAIGKRLKNGSKIGMWPGFKGAHYMEKIRAASKSEIDQVFRDALQKATAEIAKK